MKIPTLVHRLHVRTGAWIVAAAISGIAAQASGQTASKTDWHHGTTLAGFAGAAAVGSQTDLAAGAAVGWEFTPHLTVEGRGLWLAAGPGQEGFAALLGTRMPILVNRPVAPFVSAGLGVYRATFEAPPSRIPRLYERRMAAMAGDWRPRAFDDFAVAFGGGAEVFLAQHLAFRPELTVLLVTTRTNARAVPVFGVQLAYHFESRPITP
jgi:hypothetical protein